MHITKGTRHERNDEARMTNDEKRNKVFLSSFGFSYSFVIGPSSFLSAYAIGLTVNVAIVQPHAP